MKGKKLKSNLSNEYLEKLRSLIPNENIKSIKKIYIGTSNETWLIKTKYNKYQFRISFSKLNDNKQNEINVMKQLYSDDLIYCDDKFLLRKWIKGHKLIFIGKKKVNKIQEAIYIFRGKCTTISNSIDLNKYINLLPSDLKNTYKTYLSKIRNNKNNVLVPSHCDLTRNNILKLKNKMIFIDFEWSMLAYEWFDISYFLINNFRKFKKWMLKYSEIDYLIVCCLFSYSWCLYQGNKKAYKLSKRYLKWFRSMIKK